MNKHITALWILVAALAISSLIDDMSSIKRNRKIRQEFETINARMATAERTDEWFNTINKNTIKMTCEYMRDEEAKQYADKMSKAMLEAIEAGYPTNTLSGSFGGYRYVNGLMIGVETNEVAQ